MVTTNGRKTVKKIDIFSDKISIDKLAGLYNFIQSFNLEYYTRPDTEFLIKARELLRLDPISRFCVELIYLYLFSIWGDYYHPKLKINKDINNSISNCKGSWYSVLKGFASCYWYGYSWSEIAISDNSLNRKEIREIYTYDPLKYDFVIKNNEIDKIRYFDLAGYYAEIPYANGIHLTVGSDTSFDNILGCGKVEAALPYWELHKIIMPVLAIAGQRQATPILIKKTETGNDVVLINQETGQPEIDRETGEPVLVKNGWDSIRQLEELGSAGVTAIDREDDLYAISLQVSHDFLLGLIKLCEQYRMISFLVPTTIFTITNSGVGDSGLSQIHIKVFQKSILAMAKFLADEIVEKLMRPLIIYNHGEQKEYGNFIFNIEDESALEIAKVAISAIGKGKPELEDIDVLNRIRQALGVSDYTDENLK